MAGSGRTLLQALAHWTSLQPDKVLHIFIDDNGNEVEQLTYGSLDSKSSALAATLKADLNVQTGDRVLLVFPPCLDFITSFYACLKAGVIAVPVFPPDPRGGKSKKDVLMFTKIQSTSGAKVALTNKTYNFVKKLSGLKEMFSSSSVAWPDLAWHVVDQMTFSTDLSCLSTNEIDLNSPAFLQFTSGSTSDPKGVIVTHDNLAHNLELIVTCLKADEATQVVSWLPLYHDMGLIGSFLGALYCGGSGVYMSPASFIKNPTLWIESMSKYHGTHMQAPNFAYGLSARKFLALPKKKRPSHLDLSSVKHMINAAEPVRMSDINMFYAVFESYGLPKHVIFPTYGLAEHTLMVCSNGKQVLQVERKLLEKEGKVKLISSALDKENASNSVSIVGCGFPREYQHMGVDLRIVKHDSVAKKNEESEAGANPNSDGANSNPNGVQVGELQVGEIWVKSKSRAFGYWGDPEKSKQDFGGQILSQSESDEDLVLVEKESKKDVGNASLSTFVHGYLKTGDLGFIYNEELFICGRVKDLIISRGTNIYPQDIEQAAEIANKSLRGGCSAAFTLPPPSARKNRDSAHDGNKSDLSKESEEALFLVAEISDEALQDATGKATGSLSDLVSTIRSAVSSSVGCQLDAVFLLKPRTVPKTTSGKIARQWTKKAVHEDTLEVVYKWFDYSRLQNGEQKLEDAACSYNEDSKGTETQSEVLPATEMTEEEVLKMLVEAVAVTVLRVDPCTIDPTTPITCIGLGSMEGVQVLQIIEKKTGVALPTSIMFEEETTLERLVPLIMKGGGIPKRTCVVDLARLAEIDLPKQTEAERENKADKVTIKSSWRGEALPPNTLCTMPSAKDIPKTASYMLEKSFRSVLVAKGMQSALGLFLMSLLGCVTRIIATGGQTSLFSMTFVWLFMLTLSTVWVFTCLRAMQQLDEDDVQLVNASLHASIGEKTKKKRVHTLKHQVCSFFGTKILYEERLHPQDGPYFILGFRPADYLKDAEENERAEERESYVEAISSEIDNNGGLFAFAPLNDNVTPFTSTDKISLPLVTTFHKTIGSFALHVAASMHSTVFGGEEASYGSNEKNKSAVTPLPIAFLHESDQLIDLAYNDSTTTDATANNGTTLSKVTPSLAHAALSGLLQLNGSTLNNAQGGKGAGSFVDEVKHVFQKGGSVFYAASSSLDEISRDITDQRTQVKQKHVNDLKTMSGEDFGVLNTQHVVKHVYLSVVACMKHGVSIVPCLLLGDNVFGESLSKHALMSALSPLNSGVQSLSLLTALKLTLKNMAGYKDDKAQVLKPHPLAVAYGAPIALPFTSSPSPQLVMEFVHEYLSALEVLETKYAHLHHAH